MNEPRQPNEPITITLEAQQWNVVLGALGEIPWRLADPVIRAITSQANPAAPEALGEMPAVKPNGDAREIEAHAA